MNSRINPVYVLKVKGHAKRRDVLSGAALPQDKLGNYLADALAHEGADQHVHDGTEM